MKKLILGAAAGALLLSGGAFAKEKAAKPHKAATKAGKEADCDDKAKAAIESIEKATADLKESKASGKAGGHFGTAQNRLKSALAEVQKGCSFHAKADAKADAPAAQEKKGE